MPMTQTCLAGKTRWLALSLLLVFTTSGRAAYAQKKVGKSGMIPVSVHQFVLQKERDSFFLQPLPILRANPRIPLPKEWLIPLEDKADEDESPVNPYRYDPRVTSFPIGNGEIGLRFSSFEAMTEGSMALALGRDVFLIYDPRSRKLRPGGLDLGFTKERHFEAGCFHAHMVHLIVGDSNKDGLADIGAVKEEIWCPDIGREGEDSEDGYSEETSGNKEKLPAELQDLAETHQYQQHLVEWYIYGPEGWKLRPDPEWIPDTYSELPLIGITLSPVDFVGQGLWHSYNPKSWRSPMYAPAYRKHLIGGERQTRKNNVSWLKRETDRPTSK